MDHVIATVLALAGVVSLVLMIKGTGKINKLDGDRE